jgi:DNA replication protein DnaC
MNRLTDVIQLLQKIGIRLDAAALRALVDDAVSNKLSPTEVLSQLADAETRERAKRNLDRRIHAAALGTMKSLDAFEWDWPKSVDRALVDKLSTLSFVDDGHNVLFRGASGLGKTTLAKNLGLLALQQGLHVRFATLADALTDVVKHDGLLARARRLKRYTRPDVLILDEVGYIPHDASGADILFHIVSHRHERVSTIVTTNLAYKRWGEIFGGASSVQATVDRFAQHCHVVDIEGDSYRAKKSEPRPPSRRR